MKKFLCAMFVVILVPSVSEGAGYVALNYGTGGEVDESSYGIELGGIFLSSYHPRGGAFSVGLGVSLADTDEDPPATPTREYNDGNEQEVSLVLGADHPAFSVWLVGYATRTCETGIDPGVIRKPTGTPPGCSGRATRVERFTSAWLPFPTGVMADRVASARGRRFEACFTRTEPLCPAQRYRITVQP
jgi:hypothetical protein